MGLGDILLMIPIGAWIGPLAVLLCVFISSLIALFLWILFNYYKKITLNDRMPFGPYLILCSIMIKITILFNLISVLTFQII